MSSVPDQQPGLLPLQFFLDRSRDSVNRHGARLGRDIQMSQMSHVSHTSESHVRESIELGSNMLPVRDETRGSSLEAIASFSRAEPDDGHTATLTPSCFSLVLMCAVHGVSMWVPILLVIPVSVAQITVIWIITFRSPEYLFGSGRWLLPNSASKSLNAMKAFASVLMLGQIAEEFYEIGESAGVLRRSRLAKSWRWYVCWMVVAMQYVLALMVLVASDHLILSRERPIEPLWITYYVFMTLNFDNMLVRFISYVHTMERSPTWKVDVYEPTSPNSATNLRRSDGIQRLFLVWIPVFVAIMLNITSRVFNRLPITLLRYGAVTNDRPTVMMTSSMGLPHGCCPAEAVWHQNSTEDSVRFSIPCLARDAPEDLVAPPVVYWVAWPRRRGSPTSLQVREGRGADGSRGLVSGHATASPMQLRSWLQRNGYPVSEATDVFNALTEPSKGIAMYHFVFPYVAEFSVRNWPWKEDAAIYAIAVNTATGALSPEPVASDVLILFNGKCGPYCLHCSHQGVCRQCKDGYRPSGATCVPCVRGCLKCSANPSGSCSTCQDGLGLTADGLYLCMPCATKNCQNCDERHPPQVEQAAARELPCRFCKTGYGRAADGSCFRCPQKNCEKCDEESCSLCMTGFALVEDGNSTRCDPCGEACYSCKRPGWCDMCQDGFTIGKDGDCVACGDFCVNCAIRKENGCDDGGCQAGYGLLGLHEKLFPKAPRCMPCPMPHCNVCDHSDKACESCKKDFGITPSGHCAVCGPGCIECAVANICDKCGDGFVLVNGACHACGDKCHTCAASGAGSCDKGECEQGWTAISLPTKGSDKESYACRPCSDPGCSTCDIQGPGGCDDAEMFGPFLPDGGPGHIPP